MRIDNRDIVGVPSEILRKFCSAGDTILACDPLGNGRINDTYLVVPKQRPRFVLQRINPGVFPDPVCIATNVASVTAYLEAHQGRNRDRQGRFPQLVSTNDAACYTIDRDNNVWRALEYLDRTISIQRVSHSRQAFEIGRLLGVFHRLLAGLDSTALCTPIPGFHDLPAYCQAFQRAEYAGRRPRSELLQSCCDNVNSRMSEARTLRDACERGDIRKQIIHGDPKCDNFLFDAVTGGAVALIDLDTVSSGLLQHDLGDCLRSVCNPAGEGVGTTEAGTFDLQLCRNVLVGYRMSGADLPKREQSLVYPGVRLLTFELGVRFLTDYLEGDRYFKISSPEDNLHRAAVQFALLGTIEAKKNAIEAIVAEVWA